MFRSKLTKQNPYLLANATTRNSLSFKIV